MSGLLSLRFLKAVSALALLLLGVGLLMWMLERKRNAAQFGGSAVQGIGSGFWWSAVTMTTVGYGDKAPVSFWGRMLGLVWMFAGIIMVSGFTAAIASSLTVTRLQARVRGAEDLARVRVLSVRGSTSEGYLRRNRVPHRTTPTPGEALRSLERGEADAVLYDAPLLRYLVRREHPGVLRVLPNKVERQDYAIAFPEGSALREPANRALLEAIRAPWWRESLRSYLGE